MEKSTVDFTGHLEGPKDLLTYKNAHEYIYKT